MRRQISHFAQVAAALSFLTSGGSASAAPIELAASGTSEHDYFAEMPVVLSVSRLAQPLNETPGAVTVIDRDMIRRSGVRELADLMRLVPGFIVGGFNGASPMAAYHGAFNVYGTHLQVFVDGRSVYSTYYLGDTHHGLMTVALEDVERIEVLRGSNSAAYGANAFLGVVNIVTRSAHDTHGAEVSVTSGERGIADNYVRVGFGNDRASFRASLSRRADSGLDHVYDDKGVGQLHLRADLRPGHRDEVMVLAGAASKSWGDGFAAEPGNAPRTAKMDSAYGFAAWKHQFERWGDLSLSASWDEERFRDRWSYRDALAPVSLALPAPLGTLVVLPAGAYAATTVDSSGSARRAGVEAQHTLRPTDSLRAVWGGAYRHELVESPPLYYLTDSISRQHWRWFGNVEWRAHEKLLFNLGGLWEKDSAVGSRWAPRLGANFHLTSNHTFRGAITKAHRAPSLYELKGDTRFFDSAPYLAGAETNVRNAANWAAVAEPLRTVLRTAVLDGLEPAFAPIRANTLAADSRYFGSGLMLANTVRASGNAGPETLLTREIGYLGQFPALRLTVDIRAFDERFGNMLRAQNLPGVTAGVLGMATRDFVDSAPGPHLFGWEHQTRWQPWNGTRLMLSQSFIRIHSPEFNDTLNAPTDITSLAWFQDLPWNLNASLMYSTTGAFSWRGQTELLKSEHQLDLRLGWKFRVGPTRGELSGTVQQANGPRQEFLPTYTLDRRAYATLRLEF